MRCIIAISFFIFSCSFFNTNAHATELEPNAEMTSVVAQGMLEQIRGEHFERWVILPEVAMQRKSNEQNTLPQPLEINVQQSKPITLYPNPANNSVTLEYLFKAEGSVEVRDMLGKIISQRNIEQNSSINTFDTSNLTNGVYVIRVADGDNMYQHRLVIQK